MSEVVECVERSDVVTDRVWPRDLGVREGWPLTQPRLQPVLGKPPSLPGGQSVPQRSEASLSLCFSTW